MSILSDADITAKLLSKEIRIDPFFEKNLTPNGYDLTIAEVAIPKNSDKITEGTAEVSELTWFAVSTREYVKLRAKVTAQLWIRTSYARRGIMSSFGKIDAGFEGTLTLSAFNASAEVFELTIGETFAQMVLEEMSSEPKALYDERSGHYQGQRGVNLGR
ncbi:MAG: dCTP deaminase [Thermoplasmata archaeon]|nr:MAG: dCTP deaminase [Thermoplasmata archaeon]